MGIEKELTIFIQAILAGNVVCLTYYVLRVLRRIIRHNLIIISLEDVCFWIGTGIYLFTQIFGTCEGAIRWYFLVGVLSGGVLTYCLIEKIVKKYVAKSQKKE